jgi:hypothetical protein
LIVCGDIVKRFQVIYGEHPLKLNYPIPNGTETITDIVLRRPKARDLLRIEGSKAGEGMAGTIAIIAMLSGLPKDALEDLDASDLTRLNTELAGFFQKYTDEDPGSN